MSDPSAVPTIRDQLVRSATRRWLLACATGVALAGLFCPMCASWVQIVALALPAAGLSVVILAPWKMMKSLSEDNSPALQRLFEQLRASADGDRTFALDDIVQDRPDHVGGLSRLIRDLMAEVLAARQQRRLLHRHLDHSIRRETDRATADLQKQVATDPLTGLGNRRALEQRLREIADRQFRAQRTVTVMALDLDHFKHVNDALGHETGDRCLRFVGDLLKSSLRQGDTAVRLGGDEFIVLMPDQTVAGGRSLAERVKSLLAQMAWSHPGVARPTLSIGLASARADDSNAIADLIRSADAALYASKRAGRSAISVSAARDQAA